MLELLLLLLMWVQIINRMLSLAVVVLVLNIEQHLVCRFSCGTIKWIFFVASFYQRLHYRVQLGPNVNFFFVSFFLFLVHSVSHRQQNTFFSISHFFLFYYSLFSPYTTKKNSLLLFFLRFSLWLSRIFTSFYGVFATTFTCTVPMMMIVRWNLMRTKSANFAHKKLKLG